MFSVYAGNAPSSCLFVGAFVASCSTYRWVIAVLPRFLSPRSPLLPVGCVSRKGSCVANGRNTTNFVTTQRNVYRRERDDETSFRYAPPDTVEIISHAVFTVIFISKPTLQSLYILKIFSICFII